MWEKIKNIFSVIGLFLSGFFVALLYRNSADGRRRERTSGLNTTVGSTVENEKRGFRRLEQGLGEVGNGLHDATEQLQRASAILENAKARSKEVQN